MFKKFDQLKKHHQLFYSLLIAVAMVSLWRGIWRFCDLFLFTNNPVASSAVSVVVGVALIAVTHHRLG